MDNTNALRITRGLQIAIPFLTGYEAYLLDRVAAEFEKYNASPKRREPINLSYALAIAFRNRNVSRTIVQQLARYDFLWHQAFQFRYNRWMDAFGQVPWVGFTGFPASENFPSTFKHVIASILRRRLGKGEQQLA